MKRLTFIFFAAMMSSAVCHAAMSNSRVRKETRFLTDKMAYELSLSTGQYNDVYEINYDFIAGVRYLMDDVLRGEEWALNRYYDYLDVRNDDLRWVLSSKQFSRFMQASYFFRPIYVSGGRWSFRIYITYTNPNHFYFPRPYHYRTYCGGHYRTHLNHASYYRGRHKHPVYNGSYRIRDNKSYHASRRSDFGSVNIRPAFGRRPDTNRNANTSRREGHQRTEATRPDNRRSNGVTRRVEKSTPRSSESRTSRRSERGSRKEADNAASRTVKRRSASER